MSHERWPIRLRGKDFNISVDYPVYETEYTTEPEISIIAYFRINRVGSRAKMTAGSVALYTSRVPEREDKKPWLWRGLIVNLDAPDGYNPWVQITPQDTAESDEVFETLDQGFDTGEELLLDFSRRDSQKGIGGDIVQGGTLVRIPIEFKFNYRIEKEQALKWVQNTANKLSCTFLQSPFDKELSQVIDENTLIIAGNLIPS